MVMPASSTHLCQHVNMCAHARLCAPLVSCHRAVACSPHAAVLPAAGTSEQLARYCWLPARVVLCCKTDMELRCHLVEVTMKDGLLGSQVGKQQHYRM